MNKMLNIKNKRVFFILVFVIILIIGIFGFFIYKFNSYDKNVYTVQSGSIIFGKDNNYIKLDSEGTLQQKFDGNYYLYLKNDNKVTKYEIGKTAVVYNNSDSYIYLYGKAYEINGSGEVAVVEKESKIAKSSPTKLYKLDDRKYLLVDSKIKSANDTLINTEGYLIVELDTQGKANFANNELNFKAIKPIVLEGTSFKFDIANEKLVTSNDVIDLKNIIGSSNEYKEKKKSKEQNTESEEKVDNSDYYNDYLNNVIKGVNNLTNSAKQINEYSKTKLNANSVYFDFDKWIALKKVNSSVDSITLDYVVFDPNNQYDVVEVRLIDKDKKEINNSLNKNSTSFTIDNLSPNTEYKLLFGYKLKSVEDFISVDELTIKTKKPEYSITVDKIAEKKVNNNYKYVVYYSVNCDSSYVFNSAKIKFYLQNKFVLEQDINKNMLDSDYKYHGSIELSDNTNLSSLNTIKLENITFCVGETDSNCNKMIDLNVENTFSIE